MYLLSNNGKYGMFLSTANKYPGAPTSTVGFFLLVEIQFICSFHWANRTGATPEHMGGRIAHPGTQRYLYLLVFTGLRRRRNRGELKDKKFQQVSCAFKLQNCIVTPQKKTNLGEKCSHFFCCLEVQTKRTWQGSVCITGNLILYNT